MTDAELPRGFFDVSPITTQKDLTRWAQTHPAADRVTLNCGDVALHSELPKRVCEGQPALLANTIRE
jgi:hypothetical protein